MKRKMRNKRGVSIIVGYVLLVVIALSLSLLVYAWLKSQIPREREKCPESISLIIEDYSCDKRGKTLDITFQNKGLFNVNGFIIRIRNVSDGKTYTLESGGGGIENFFVEAGKLKALKPNEKATQQFSYSKYGRLVEIEIEPFITEQGIVLCENAIISQEIVGCD